MFFNVSDQIEQNSFNAEGEVHKEAGKQNEEQTVWAHFKYNRDEREETATGTNIN